MSVIKINLPDSNLYDGQEITFRAPCGCSAANGLKICDKEFTLVDALGNNLLGIEGLFIAGSLVSVRLDVSNLKAYLQNAATHVLDPMDSYKPPQNFNSDVDALSYADSILSKYDNAFVPITVANGSISGANNSSGFITTKFDTCSVVLFQYNTGRICVNSRSKDRNWSGWKRTLTIEDFTESGDDLILEWL
jgi:hypothetical protein